jgi:hypothetical protein
VANYHSTLRVRENPGGRGCTVEWSSDFEPSGVPESEAMKIVRGIFDAGFDNLRRMFGTSSKKRERDVVAWAALARGPTAEAPRRR